MRKEDLSEIMRDKEKCEILAKQMLSLTNSTEKDMYYVGFDLLRAYAGGNVDDAVIALCGWSLEDICVLAGLLPDAKGILSEEPTYSSNEKHATEPTKVKNVVYLYTDGACKGNPGPGGWGAILKADGFPEKELCGGEEFTTNNKMELMAAIAGLEAIKKPCKVILTSDSKYLVDSVTKGWIDNWRSQGWIKANKPVPNADLWKRLLVQLERHDVEFRWVRGHAGHPENERCDKLAVNYICRNFKR